jgi:hypothetical protein
MNQSFQPRWQIEEAFTSFHVYSQHQNTYLQKPSFSFYSAALLALLTALKAFSTGNEAAMATTAPCEVKSVDDYYKLCKAEVDSNPSACGPQCQAALQVSHY